MKRPLIELLLQPWSTATSQTKNNTIAPVPRILSSMMGFLSPPWIDPRTVLNPDFAALMESAQGRPSRVIDRRPDRFNDKNGAGRIIRGQGPCAAAQNQHTATPASADISETPHQSETARTSRRLTRGPIQAAA
jgi:hypothetical protein